MKKNTHPQKNTSLIVLHNGSTFLKKWNFFKKFIKTDSDFLNTILWKKKNK